MPDPTNDIDALLDLLAAQSRFGFHSALTALVAERDALKEMHAHLGQSYTMLAKECNALKQRIAQLESQEFTLPHDPFRDPDRDLRERLVCAIWPEILRIYERSDYDANWDKVRILARSHALQDADAMIAAMRKGDANE